MSALGPIDVDGALAVLDAMKAEYVWCPERVLDEILSLQFGAPSLAVHKPLRNPAGPGIDDTHALTRYTGVKGWWNLYVEGGEWTVSAAGYTCGRFDMELPRDVRCLHGLRGQVLTGTAREAARREWRLSFDLGGTVTIAAPDPAMTVFTDYEWTLFRQGEPGLTCLRDDRLELGDA